MGRSLRPGPPAVNGLLSGDLARGRDKVVMDPVVMRVISANVNGIRAATRRGGGDWLRAAEPDVLCLQEVRADEVNLDRVLSAAGFGDWAVAHTEGSTKGRAGVAVVSALPHKEVRVGIDDGFAEQGRWVEADIVVGGDVLTLASAYVHTGEAGTGRQAEKYAFLDAMTGRMARARDEDALMVVTGDLNIAHGENDLKNWKGNLGRSGFLPGEQAYLDGWFRRARLGRRPAAARRRPAGTVHVVVLARPGLRQRQRLADRLPARLSRPGSFGPLGIRRTGGIVCRTLERPCAGRRRLRRSVLHVARPAVGHFAEQLLGVHASRVTRRLFTCRPPVMVGATLEQPLTRCAGPARQGARRSPGLAGRDVGWAGHVGRSRGPVTWSAW